VPSLIQASACSAERPSEGTASTVPASVNKNSPGARRSGDGFRGVEDDWRIGENLAWGGRKAASRRNGARPFEVGGCATRREKERF
jgi:hypothetical protein